MTEPVTLTAASEYQGQTSIRVAATQLSSSYSRTEAARIVAGWVDLFSSGPLPLADLQFVSRTPRRLFEALAGQTQLKRLAIKWGDYDSLECLAGLARLEELRLLGASRVETLAPLGNLKSVKTLEIDSLLRVHDLSPIASMTSVADLTIGGDWMSMRNAHVDSLDFLTTTPQLERLLLHTIIVGDLDYTPILHLPNLQRFRVMATRQMRPTIEELRALPSWSDK